MALCKYCNMVFQWGQFGEKWVPLVPTSEHDDLDRTYQDEEGQLRAPHSAVCINKAGPAVQITKLSVPVQASDVLPTPKREPFTIKRKRKKKATGYEG